MIAIQVCRAKKGRTRVRTGVAGISDQNPLLIVRFDETAIGGKPNLRVITTTLYNPGGQFQINFSRVCFLLSRLSVGLTTPSNLLIGSLGAPRIPGQGPAE